MSMLDDYKRVIQAPMIREYEETIAALRAEIERLSTPSQRLDAATVSDDGYQQAFYETAEMLGIEGPQPLSPKQVWETQMKPRLSALTTLDAATVEREGE